MKELEYWRNFYILLMRISLAWKLSDLVTKHYLEIVKEIKGCRLGKFSFQCRTKFEVLRFHLNLDFLITGMGGLQKCKNLWKMLKSFEMTGDFVSIIMAGQNGLSRWKSKCPSINGSISNNVYNLSDEVIEFNALTMEE